MSDPLAVPLFSLAARRLSWAAARERVLAQNIANLDTPGYRPKDTATFAATLSAAAPAADLALTAPGHLPGTATSAQGVRSVAENGRQPDGNAVSLDTELEKLADTDSAAQVTTAIYQSYLGLFRTALGQGTTG
ncbi:MAG TPA: flagellar basal body protein [Acetobacteraceae bacterium]|nr:flagellar basal body protein [Acetobacteraceae bacterium]